MKQKYPCSCYVGISNTEKNGMGGIVREIEGAVTVRNDVPAFGDISFDYNVNKLESNGI
jgi:hypothetical protein